MQPIVVSGFVILAHASESSCFGLYSLFIGVVGRRSILSGVFSAPPPPPLLSTVYQFDGCLSSRGHEGSWLGCQVLPAICALSILELAANSGSSRLSQASKLHLSMQFLSSSTQLALTVNLEVSRWCHSLWISFLKTRVWSFAFLGF